MRVLFATVPNKSHTYIAAPLAWALRNAGHDVLVAAQDSVVDAITPTGLTGVALGPAPETDVTQRMNDSQPEQPPPVPLPPGTPKETQLSYGAGDPAGEFAALVGALWPVLSPDPVIDDLVALARAWQPDLVVWDMLSYAGPVAARACGAAHCRLVLATDGNGQLRRDALAADPSRDPVRDWLEPKLDRLGQQWGEDVAVGQWTLDLMPDWTYHPDGLELMPVRHVPFNGPGTAPPWLFEPVGGRRVCLTLGNSHREAGRTEASVPELLDAVADCGAEVVATLTRDQAEAAGTLPANVRPIGFVPLNTLLPTCDVIVHHGGAGTFAAAVEHGVPQVLVPSAWWSERFFGPVAMANGLAEQGAGVYVCNSDQLTAPALRAELDRVLADASFAENASRLAASTALMPTPNDVVPALEKLTDSRRGAYQ
jgi:glycosyltransferase (activator-dependent family)